MMVIIVIKMIVEILLKLKIRACKPSRGKFTCEGVYEQDEEPRCGNIETTM